MTEREFWVFWGIFIAAAAYWCGGEALWETKNEGLLHSPSMGQYMKHYRFKQIKALIPMMFADESKRTTDPWWQFIAAVESFNAKRKEMVAASIWKTLDESMSALRPRTTQTGGLPNISYIERKPKPLGTQFKNFASVIVVLFNNLKLIVKQFYF